MVLSAFCRATLGVFLSGMVANAPNRLGLLDENLVQHEEFHHGLHDLDIYLAKVKNRVADFDGEKVVALLEGFTPSLRTHLEDEITTLLKLEEYDVPWADVMKKVTEHAVNTPNPVSPSLTHSPIIFPITPPSAIPPPPFHRCNKLIPY